MSGARAGDGTFRLPATGPSGEHAPLIKELMQNQVSRLSADLSESPLDTDEIAQRAEMIYHYAKCLRDFPDLPELIQTKFPGPPLCFEAYLEPSDSLG